MRNLLARLVGKPRDLRDPRIFHHVSLIAFFAWVGLGSDGLSSSAYGPEEAFRHLGEHRYLAVFLAVAMAGTVFVISATYSRVIEHFPAGGGGYAAGFGLGSNSTPMSCTPDTPSIMQWCTLPKSALRSRSSPSTWWSSHSGRSRSSGRAKRRDTRRASCVRSPGARS